MANSGNAREDGRDDDLRPLDPERTSKNDPHAPAAAAAAAPASLALVLTDKASAAAVRTSPLKKGFRVGAGKKKQAAAAAARVVRPSTAALDKSRRPPLSPTSTTAAILKGCNQNLRRSLGGRVLSEHRSRLTSKMLEALMCSQDWLRNKYKVDEKNKKAATFWSCLQDIQEGLQELAL